jgi:hypothetical protein
MLEVFWAKERARASAKRRRPPGYMPPPQKPSDHQEWINKVKELPDVRQQKIRDIRQALEDGQYDVEHRISELFEKLPEKLPNLQSTDE